MCIKYINHYKKEKSYDQYRIEALTIKRWNPYTWLNQWKLHKDKGI